MSSDVLIIDPLISIMGGASQNDNAAAALFMGQLVGVAAKRRIAVMVAHHAAKGRDPVSADSAMRAASFVNLSRIALAIEPLAAADAGSVGLPPWEARSVFRLVGTKHNLSPPTEGDRWFRLESVEMPNAEPPIYPIGDKVGVVEVFQPGVCGPRFSPEMIRDALRAIDSAPTPPSPSKRATGRYAGPLIAQAIAPHRGGRVSDIEAEAVLDHIIRSSLVVVQQVKLTRSGGRSDVRSGLVLTSAGKQEAHGVQSAPSNSSFPAVPAVPATFARGNAGGAPLGPPQRPRGCGGNAGAPVAGAPEAERNSSASKTREAHAPTPSVAAEGVLQPAQLAPVVSPAEPPAVLAPASELGAPALAVLDPAAPAAVSAPSDHAEGLDIPPFLDRRRWAQKKIWGRRRATQASTRPMTPITSSNLRSSSPHRNRAGCALTALPCAAVYYPTVLRFDVAIGQRPSARFEGDAAKHHTNQVLPPLPRRLRLLPSAAAVSAFTKSFHTMRPAPGRHSSPAVSGFCRAHLIATLSHRCVIDLSRRRRRLVSQRFHYFDRPCSALDGSLPSHGYLGGYALPLARHAPCKSITPFHSIIPENAPAAVVVSL